MLFSSAGGERVGDVLGEDAHGVQAGGRDGGIVRGLEVELAPELFGEAASASCSVALLPLSLRQWGVDLAEVMWLQGAGPGDEVRQLAQQDVELHRASFDWHERTFSVQVGSADLSSMRSVRTGSAFEMTTAAMMRSPLCSNMPSPGRMRATSTPAATVAPASRAASQK